MLPITTTPTSGFLSIIVIGSTRTAGVQATTIQTTLPLQESTYTLSTKSLSKTWAMDSTPPKPLNVTSPTEDCISSAPAQSDEMPTPETTTTTAAATTTPRPYEWGGPKTPISSTFTSTSSAPTQSDEMLTVNTMYHHRHLRQFRHSGSTGLQHRYGHHCQCPTAPFGVPHPLSSPRDSSHHEETTTTTTTAVATPTTVVTATATATTPPSVVGPSSASRSQRRYGGGN